jgi:NAD(P)-dependent dehydrogenase (short-subunit alcohol dehydrogenase family)
LLSEKYGEKCQRIIRFNGKLQSSRAVRAGLAKEMAEGLAEAGANLMLCARREEWLAPTVEEFAGAALTSKVIVRRFKQRTRSSSC